MKPRRMIMKKSLSLFLILGLFFIFSACAPVSDGDPADTPGTDSPADEECSHYYDSDCDTECNECGASRTADAHVYYNDCDTTCNACGDTRTVNAHVYDNACDKICNECADDTRTVGPHIYDNACDDECNECGTFRSVGSHIYDNDCDQFCNECNASRTVRSHQYDNACDTTCNECGDSSRVTFHRYTADCDRLCNVCNAERTAAEHTYDNSCDDECNECHEIRAVGDHSYGDDGIVCIICGAHYYTEGLVFKDKGDAYTVVGYTGTSENVIIPATYKGKPVTVIDTCAFYNCMQIRSVEIPLSVSRVDLSAFYACDAIESITAPLSILNNGSTPLGDMFYPYGSGYNKSNSWVPASLKNLTLTMYEGTTAVLGSALSSLQHIECVSLPEGVTALEGSFYSCRSLKKVIMPSTLTEIDSDTMQQSPVQEIHVSDLAAWASVDVPARFMENKKLILNGSLVNGELILPEGIQKIGSNVFSFYKYITAISIPASVTSIGEKAFYTSENIKSITFENGVKEIGNEAFSRCKNLTNLVLPNSLESIGEEAFSFCTGLITVRLGSNLSAIGNNAFYVCDSVCEVINKSSLPYTTVSYHFKKALTIHSEESKLVYNGDFIFCSLSSGYTAIVGYVGEGGVVTLPETYNGGGYSIWKSAFVGKTDLVSITIPSNVSSIEDGAFSQCYKLVEIINHSSINLTVGASTHGGIAAYAKEIHDEESKIENVDGYLFYSSYLIASPENHGVLTLPDSYNGGNYSIYQYAFYSRDNITALIIPDAVLSIGTKAFYNCNALETLSVEGNGLNWVEANAFYGCDSLSGLYITDISAWCNVSFQSSTNALGDEGWANPLCCAKDLYVNGKLVTTLVIPEGVTAINPRTFWGGSFESVVIPKSITYIGLHAFYNTTATVYYAGNESEWNYVSVATENTYWEPDTHPHYYYSENPPSSEGDFWHYDDDGSIVIW